LEQKINDPNSLFLFYKKLIQLKQIYPAFDVGRYENAPNDNPAIYSFYRKEGTNTMLVSVNLSDKVQEFVYSDFKQSATNIWDTKQKLQHKNIVQPYQISIWKMK
jgi:glycosidase